MSTATTQTVPTGTYSLDPVHSTFGFAVKHNGVSTFRGQFEQVDARLEDGVLTGIAQAESVKTAIPDLSNTSSRLTSSTPRRARLSSSDRPISASLMTATSRWTAS